MAQARVPSRTSVCETCGPTGSETGSAPSILVFPVSPHQCSVFIFILILLLFEGKTGEASEPTNKALLFLLVSGISGQNGTFNVGGLVTGCIIL